MVPKSAVLIPLYIYPSPGAWEPLHKEITTHPSLDFTIVLNPHNGPGSSGLPDANYAFEISRLNAYANVRTVGYVHIGYGKRDASEVRRDVATYAGWSMNVDMQGVAVHGIFLDETPNRYSAKTAEYLDAVRQEVKNSSGILGDRMVIYNPGSIPDTRFANLGPDLTAVFEETYQTYRSKALQDRLSSVPYARSRCCYIVHSVPSNEVRQLVTQLRHRAGYLFLTGLSENYYASFGPTWSDFVAAMSTE